MGVPPTGPTRLERAVAIIELSDLGIKPIGTLKSDLVEPAPGLKSR